MHTHMYHAKDKRHSNPERALLTSENHYTTCSPNISNSGDPSNPFPATAPKDMYQKRIRMQFEDRFHARKGAR